MSSINKEEYNSIPVHYCKHCLSLKIRIIENDSDNCDYCDDCGSTDIGVTSISEWKKLHDNKYLKK